MAHRHPFFETLIPQRHVTLADRVASLSRDIARLADETRRQATPRVEEAAHAVGDFAGDVVHQLEPMARDVARRAHHVGRMVRTDPVPAIIALGTFALIASLVLRRQ